MRENKEITAESSAVSFSEVLAVGTICSSGLIHINNKIPLNYFCVMTKHNAAGTS